MISPMPGPGCGAGAVCRDHTASRPEKDATVDPASAIHASAQRRVSSASIEKPTPNTSASQTEHPRRQRDAVADRRIVARQHVPAPGVAGVRQHERQQQHEHGDGDDQCPCAGVDFTRDAAFGGLDVALELFEACRCSVACGHRAHPDDGRLWRRGADAGHAEADTGARPLPRRVGVARRGCAGAQRCAPSAIRWCGAAPVTVVVTMSPGRMSRRAGVEVHQPAVACPSGHPCGAGVLAAFARGHQQLDGAPDLRGVLLQRDPLLKVDQPLIAFLHNGFG